MVYNGREGFPGGGTIWNGNWFEKTFTELGAQCVCHETAHLDGQLFVDVVEEFVQPEEVK